MHSKTNYAGIITWSYPKDPGNWPTSWNRKLHTTHQTTLQLVSDVSIADLYKQTTTKLDEETQQINQGLLDQAKNPWK